MCIIHTESESVQSFLRDTSEIIHIISYYSHIQFKREMWRNIIYYHCFWGLIMSAEQGILTDAIGIMLLLTTSGVPNPQPHGPALVHGLPGTGPCKEVKSHPYTYRTTKPRPHPVCRKTALHRTGLQHPKGWGTTGLIGLINRMERRSLQFQSLHLTAQTYFPCPLLPEDSWPHQG